MKKSARKTKRQEEVTPPETVSVLAQLMLPLAELIRGDLRELVHTLGMQAIATLLEQERTERCGPVYAHARCSGPRCERGAAATRLVI